MRAIDSFIIGSTHTKPGENLDARDVDIRDRKRGYLRGGFHHIILRSGTIEEGRPHPMVGAHCRDHNIRSIGICLVGGAGEDGRADNNYTVGQWLSLKLLLIDLKLEFPNAEIYGANEYSHHDNPSFDVRAWVQECITECSD